MDRPTRLVAAAAAGGVPAAAIRAHPLFPLVALAARTLSGSLGVGKRTPIPIGDASTGAAVAGVDEAEEPPVACHATLVTAIRQFIADNGTMMMPTADRALDALVCVRCPLRWPSMHACPRGHPSLLMSWAESMCSTSLSSHWGPSVLHPSLVRT